MEPLKVGVVIGRFQPVHKMHLEALINPALSGNDFVVCLLGSSLTERTLKNPFTWILRESMIMDLVPRGSHIYCEPIRDYPDENGKWEAQVRKIIHGYVTRRKTDTHQPVEITLYGTQKDASSFYLKWFPEWHHEVNEPDPDTAWVSSTYIREQFYRWAIGVDSEAFHDMLNPKTAFAMGMWSAANGHDGPLQAYLDTIAE